MAEQAKQKLNQFRADRQNLEVQVTDSNVGGFRWICQQDGWVKTNFDGAIFSDSNQFRVGVVIQDNNNVVLASYSEKLHQAYKPDEVEALAALKVVSLASDLGFRNVILEGDSLSLIKALKSVEDSLSPTGLLVDDMKRVASSFERLMYSHVKRNGNRVTHKQKMHYAYQIHKYG